MRGLRSVALPLLILGALLLVPDLALAAGDAAHGGDHPAFAGREQRVWRLGLLVAPSLGRKLSQ